MVAQIAGRKALPDDVIDQIADRTDGVPLFIEELTRSVLESGLLHGESDRYVVERALPPRDTDDTPRLAAGASIVSGRCRLWHIGAAIGRQFPYPLLRAVSRPDENQLQAALGRLVASELVFQRGTPPDAVYALKHALVRDAAHDILLHAQIAEAIESLFPS